METRIAPPGRVVGQLYLGALAVVAVAMLVPLLLGSFDGGEIELLVGVDLGCLVALAAGAHLLSRRLVANQDALWALSRCDELTGVGNYRALQERLAEEVVRHARHQRELALILIDLDGFKQVNEKLGHLEGDRLLARIGEALRDEVRMEDSVFRQGGDEFAVIAPETNGEEAEDVAARIRGRVRGCGDEQVGISGATGLAIFPGDGRTVDALLDCADRDLLGAKRGNRPA
jgi:diguanylate cyclase (GGDEF)-like protein